MDPYVRVGHEILRIGGCDPTQRVRVEQLAAGLGMSLEFDAIAYGGHANAGIVVHAGKTILWTRPGLPVVRRRELQMRVIAEWHLRRDGARPCTARELAPSVAACIMAPRPAMTAAWRSTEGRPLFDRVVRASLQLGAPSACVALRVGEVTRRPVAVVTPTRVIRRGDPELDEMKCRSLAEAGPPDPSLLCTASPDRHTHTIIVKQDVR